MVVVVAAAVSGEEEAEHPFVEECDLSEGAACLMLGQMVQDSIVDALLQITLRCYSYSNNIKCKIYMNNY